MLLQKLLIVSALAFASIRPVTGQDKPNFVHDVKTKRTPWTHTKFFNNPSNFQFAIVADVTGGERQGVFPAAVKKLNLLKPEFIMSVGDLIKGYTKDKATLLKEWDRFDATVKRFEMPFFYIPGNHDITNKVMDDLYLERYGRSYYYFVYKDVLFLCLNTQQTDGYVFNKPGRFISEKQVGWAKEVLKKHPKVKWTFVFMHQPLWVYNQSKETGFQELEKALKGRQYTVFAGHLHAYAKYVRNNQKYFMLATTGGGSKLRSVEQGEFDHVVWVTMTDKGPAIANLLVDGIHDGDVRTEEMKTRQIREAYFLKSAKLIHQEGEDKFAVKMSNPFEVPLKYALSWEGKGWHVAPAEISGVVRPRKTVKKFFTLKKGSSSPGQIPVCMIKFSNEEGLQKQKELSAKTVVRQLRRPQYSALAVQASPKIDGKLDDRVWDEAQANTGFRAKPDGREASTSTVVKVAYDENNLYVAFKCEEANRSKVVAKAKEHDGPVWKDDSVEVFLDTDQDRKTYYQLIVNSLGVTYDGSGDDKKVDLSSVVATAWDDQGFAVEIAIPWEKMKVKRPVAGSKWGVAFVRTRTQTKELQQLPYLFGENHQPEMFGTLQFTEKQQ